jgi:Tol biopolymer transport system component
MLPPPGTTFDYGANAAPVTVSPDGRRLAFGARQPDGTVRLWVRDLDAAEPFSVPGGEGGLFPFWSPDSRFLGFFARGAVKVVEASPAPQPARVLATDVSEARGGSWAEDGTILYSPGNRSHLMRIPASGGKAEPATRLETGEISHRWPRFLPGGRRFLFELRTRRPGESAGGQGALTTVLTSLDKQEKRVVLTDDRSAAYAPPGFLVFSRASNLMAVACDPESLALRGEPAVLDSRLSGFVAPGSPYVSASKDLLVYSLNIGTRPSRLVWLDRSGKELSTVGQAGDFFTFALSSDARLAVAAAAAGPGPPDLWTYDTTVGRGIRLTRDAAPQIVPVLSPDSRRIFYSSYSRGPWDIWEAATRGEFEPKPFLESETTKTPNDVSPDGRYLLYREFNPGSLGDLKFVPLDGDRQPRTFAATADDETNGDFSPDGRWVVYTSDASGRKEIYAASFPEPARRLRVTSEGGAYPRWSRDGKEIFYFRSGQLFAVPVAGKGDDLEFGQERALFAMPLFTYGDSGFDAVTRYDVSSDGRFLALLPVEGETDRLVVVLHWAEALKKP